MADFASYSSSSSVTTTTTSQFRAKVSQMKAWRPAHPPSNRDRLELYALHKQAVSGDIPSQFSTPTYLSNVSSLAEKAKLNAWRSKSGIPRAQAMMLYIQECDRQLRVYGVSHNNFNNNSNNNSNNNNNNKSNNDTPSKQSPTKVSSNQQQQQQQQDAQKQQQQQHAQKQQQADAGAGGRSTSSSDPKSNISSPGPGHQTPNNTPAPKNEKEGNQNDSSHQQDDYESPNKTNKTKNTNDNDTRGAGGGGGGDPGTNHPPPHREQVLLTPRGLAAVPLLAAAAAESRMAYLSRLAQTPLMQGWWAKQEPLCADPGTLWALPETFVLSMASTLEWISLKLQHGSNNQSSSSSPSSSPSSSSSSQEQTPFPQRQENEPSPPQSSSTNNSTNTNTSTNSPTTRQNQILLFSPTILQSFLWPLHNTLLAIWIVIIFLSTIGTTALLSLRIALLGHPQISLSTLFSKEILPASRAATSLCEYHQAVSIRLTGLVFMPYVSICQMSHGISNDNNNNNNNNNNTVNIQGGMGIWVGAVLYCTCLGFTWWYWTFIVPWFAFAGAIISLSCGWCFALIEMAGVAQE